MFGFRAEKRLKVLEESLEKALRDFQNLRMEWDDTLHRLSRMMGRLAKAEAKIASSTDTDSPPPSDGPGAFPGAGGTLTERQRAIQQQILRRRSHL